MERSSVGSLLCTECPLGRHPLKHSIQCLDSLHFHGPTEVVHGQNMRDDQGEDVVSQGQGPYDVSGGYQERQGTVKVNESGTYEGGLIRDQAAVTAVHTVNARARNIRC